MFFTVKINALLNIFDEGYQLNQRNHSRDLNLKDSAARTKLHNIIISWQRKRNYIEIYCA